MKYEKLLPLQDDVSVLNQFGHVPLSVFTPKPRPEVDSDIKDDGDHKTRRSEDAEYLPGLKFSSFKPDLAEFIVRYWSLVGDLIVDPFAGRRTRAVVALQNGRRYQGYEVAPNTYAESADRIAKVGGSLVQSDGCLMASTENESSALVFTCPPYHDIEKYESCPGQLSDCPSYSDFLSRVETACVNTYRVLIPGGFACWVVADWRANGQLVPFHADLITLMQRSQLQLWDIVVVRNNSPFAALQAAKVASKRYTSKTHEYLMVFRKDGPSRDGLVTVQTQKSLGDVF